MQHLTSGCAHQVPELSRPEAKGVPGLEGHIHLSDAALKGLLIFTSPL